MALRWVEELVNTRSVEFGTDEITTPDALAGWLRDRELIPAALPVTGAEHEKAVRMREGLRALLFGGGAPGLAKVARELPLVLDMSQAPPRLVPRDPGTVDAALASLLAVVARATADGTWSRLKVCRNPGCQWAYHDSSRNRSRAWCSMETCGNRAKARAFRDRA